MDINQTCKLFLTDLYFYDFKSAYPRIMESIGWDFEDVDIDNKMERNINIGKSQSDNENLSAFLIDLITNLINYYISKNSITEDDIIIKQRDGFISKKQLDVVNDFMTLDFRDNIRYMILSPDRKKYVLISDSTIDVKGISNMYSKMKNYYKIFLKLNFMDRKSLFSQLNKYRLDFLNITDKKIFMIPTDKEFVVQTLNGARTVKDENSFSLSDINKQVYFDHYVKEFFQSIFIEFTQSNRRVL